MQLYSIVLGLFTSFCTANFYFNMFIKCFSTNDICVICHYNFIYLLIFCCLSFLLLWTPLYYVRCVIIIVLFFLFRLQVELPNSRWAGWIFSLGTTVILWWWWLYWRSCHDQGRESWDHRKVEEQPLAGPWNSCRVYWLHGLQCQHQSLLRYPVTSELKFTFTEIRTKWDKDILVI